MSVNLIGRTLGKYRILEEIGRGGMGVVYKAHDTVLDRPVALKVLAPHLTWDQEFVQRFHREARAAARLKHPHIVTIYDVGEVRGHHFIAMDYLEGQPLSTLIRREGPLPPERVAHIVEQIAQALDYAHAQGLVHRDVKPGNVIVGPQDHATLTDFGVAKALAGTRLTQSGVMVGTPAYMSPEQVKGQPVGPATDVYSLGVVAYEMLGGRPPFEGETPHVLHAHAYDPPPPLRQVNPRVPDAVAAVVHKALAKEPGQRYRSAGDFAAGVGEAIRSKETEVVRGLPPRKPPPPPVARAGQEVFWPLFGVLGAVLLIAVLALGIGIGHPGSGPAPVESPGTPPEIAVVATATQPLVTPGPHVGASPTVQGQATGAAEATITAQTQAAVAQAANTRTAVAATQMAIAQTGTIQTVSAANRTAAAPTKATLRVVAATKTAAPQAKASPTVEASQTPVVTPRLTSASSTISLLEPNNEAVASGLVAFRWTWAGKLAPGEIFDVRVCHRKDCQPTLGKTNVAETTWLWCPNEGGGLYRWMVVVIDGATKQEKGPRSEVWEFTWGGICGHSPGSVEGGVLPTPPGGAKYSAPRGVVAEEVWCGHCVKGGAKIRVRWLWDGTLGPSEAFEIKVIEEFDNVGLHVARQGIGAWTNGRECPGYTPGGPSEWCWERDYTQIGDHWKLRFTVAVIQTLDGGKSQLSSPVSNEATFGWQREY